MSKTLLLVEDDEDNRDLVSFVLSRSRLDVDLQIAENGQEAIDKAFSKTPHLILMDMQMPVMDGWHAVPILKADDRTKHVPIIAFTAQAKPEDKVRTKEIGCAEHYSKPMDPEELLNLIQKYLNS
ncbi:MAG: response regulator [Ignavibacteriales bacterium]|nr:response regulator [Ignavibacteriales bacterium]